VVPHPRAVSASRGPGLNRPAGPHHLGATGGQPAMSTDHLYGFGHIIVQSDRTDSGTADGTHMTAPWLDSRAPTTAGLTHEESESMAVAAASPTPIVSHDWRHKRQHPSSTSELSERAAPLDFCKLMCPNPYRRFMDTPASPPIVFKPRHLTHLRSHHAFMDAVVGYGRDRFRVKTAPAGPWGR
jgi:hypothetical protein